MKEGLHFQFFYAKQFPYPRRRSIRLRKSSQKKDSDEVEGNKIETIYD